MSRSGTRAGASGPALALAGSVGYYQRPMSELRLYNTLNREQEAFVPKRDTVGVYLCGPTVYDIPHAGHARSALAFDILVRRLRARGLNVRYVRNLTDIDDKILARARELDEAPLQLSERMAVAYQEDMRAIGCLDPDAQPKVSEHIPQIIELVTGLIENGSAYVLERRGGTKDVYFSVRSFDGYGKLSRRKIDELRAGARVAEDEEKRDALDFALWKGAKEDDFAWDSPWGKGRPGWHIECSAMSCEQLGHGFDIHAGGMDLIFPHHENEIAQSEAAHPGKGDYARFWLHNGFVNVDKEKMSKSLGNFMTVRDVLERNDPEGFRYFLLGVQYRGPIQFDTDKLDDGRVVFPGVDEAERRVDYLYETLQRLADLVDRSETVPNKHPPEIIAHRDAAKRARADAEAGLDDDLNTPVALAALGELARHANELCDLAHKRRKDGAFVGSAAAMARLIQIELRAVSGQLGLLNASVAEYSERTRVRRLKLRGLSADDVAAKVKLRDEARAGKDFATSDRIRDELAASGVMLKDSPAGTIWTIEA